jgi:hypothetical protein
MTPEQKIMHLIINVCARWDDKSPPDVNSENVDYYYSDLDEDYCSEAVDEIRSGEVETNIPCCDSRNYEAHSVAAQAPDGTWVGWTYWTGGGKFGNPEEVEWMSKSYNLECTEQEELVTVREFKIKR